MARGTCLNILLSTCFLLLITVLPKPAGAEIRLLDGDLILRGFVKETAYINTQLWDRAKKYRSNADFSMTSVYFEGLYTITEDIFGTTLRFFSGYRWWWEKSVQFDRRQRRTVLPRNRDDYQRPVDWEDYITEMYFDYDRGPLQVRVGKQIVIWGQLNTRRVADVVNPLDFRWGYPGLDTWEEIKKGLWMIRTFYVTNLPGNLLFEFIYNPGHYQALELTYGGTHWGTEHFKEAGFNPGREMGFYTWTREKMKKDRPSGFDTRNTEFGGRIRGYTFGVDWTLLYWNARDDGAVSDPRRINDFALQYVFAGIWGAMTDSRVNPGRWPSYRVFHYKRYQTVGGTAQKMWPAWFRYATWDMEWYLEIKRPMNLGTGGSNRAVYDWTRKNILGIALRHNDTIKLPKGFQDFIRSNKDIDFNITYFWNKIFNHRRDLVTADRFHRPGDSVSDGVSVWAKVELLNTSIVFVPLGEYYFRTGMAHLVLPVTYMFPDPYGGLRLDVGMKLYWRKRHKILPNDMDKKDAVILRLRYEF